MKWRFWLGNLIFSQLVLYLLADAIHWPLFHPPFGPAQAALCSLWFSGLAQLVAPRLRLRGWRRMVAITLMVWLAVALTGIAAYVHRESPWDCAFAALLTFAASPGMAAPVILWGLFWGRIHFPAPAAPTTAAGTGLLPGRL